jgi:SAM-dependent methyltransferase
MTTQSHYENHSISSYESAYFYSEGEYTEYLSRIVTRRLGLEPTSCRRILDVGGGTGNFTRMLLRKSPEVEAIVIDPFLLEINQSDVDGNRDSTISNSNSSSASPPVVTNRVKFVKASAEIFLDPPTEDTLWWRQDYHQVLMKEVIHHIDSSNRIGVFSGILGDLPEKPSNDPGLLIVTRPSEDIDYPIWAEAKDVWAQNQPSLKQLQYELEQAGFSYISNTIEGYPCEIKFERWVSMIKNRFWSTFSHFSNQELDDACEQLRRDESHRIDENGIIRFEDRLLFISAFK